MFLAMAQGFWGSVRLVLNSLYEVAVSLGGPGLFFVALADSSFLSLPESNDLLIVVLSTGQDWSRMTYLVVMTILGSIGGCSILYSIGRRGGSFLKKRVKEQKIREVEGLYQRWGIWAVVVPSILPPPTPFKIFVLSAGLFGISYPKFFFAVALGRSIRYFMWGVLAVLYGEWAKEFLEQNVTAVGTGLFVMLVAIIAGFGLMRIRARKRSPQRETA